MSPIQQQDPVPPLRLAAPHCARRYAEGPGSPLARRLSSLSTGEITVEALEAGGEGAGAAALSGVACLR